ncbi:MAG: signal transducer AmpG-like protein [Gemmatimonadota bacterium]|nr:MAG: signal transducer AmpG-like protein [Gemmatimonadota bacterium]
MKTPSPLETRRGRITTFTLLYLSEGIPFGFSAIALVTYLRQQGVGLAEIGFYSAWLYGPWSLKWAWAPLIDLIRPARFGPRRFWIAFAHIGMILTMALLLVFDPSKNFQLLTIVMVIHNVFSATQDVAIDALAVDVLEEEERGVANGFMFGGQVLGQTIGGSGALYVTSAFGFEWSYAVVLGSLALILFFVTFRIREAPTLAQTAPPRGRILRESAARLKIFGRDLFDGFLRSGKGPRLGLLFALLPSGAVALGLALGTTLQVDLGMSDRQIADLTLFSTVLGAVGCVLGGWISDRLGHKKMLMVFYAVTVLPTLWLARQFTGDGMAGVTLGEFWFATIAYAFCSGLLNGTYLAIFMGLTSVRVAATQFTGYMALGNAAYAYSSVWQGRIAASQGYAAVLVIDSLIVLVPVLIAPFLTPSTRGHAPPAEA